MTKHIDLNMSTVSNSQFSQKDITFHPQKSAIHDAYNSTYEDPMDYYWYCQNCGRQAYLSVRFNDFCVECLCARDVDCPVETIFRVPLEKQIQPASWYGNSETNNRLAASPTHSIDDNGLEQLSDASDEFPCYSMPESHTNSNAVSPSSMNHEPEMRLSVKEDVTLGNQHDTHILDILESCLVRALDEYGGSATNILPKVRYLMSSMTENEGYRSTQNTERTTASSAGHSLQSNNSSSKYPEGKNKSNESNKRKRSRKPNDDDKQPRKQVPRNFAKPISTSPTFACPYHKHDPVKHCADNPQTRKYRNCMDPVISDLRRITDHLEAAHVCFKCEHCGKEFRKSADRIMHHKTNGCGSNGPGSLVDGINFAQWTAICELLGSKRGDGIWKWNAIYSICFPGAPLPVHPWKDNWKTMSSLAPIIDANCCLQKFERIIASFEEIGVLPKNDPMSRIFKEAIKLALADGSVEEAVSSVRQNADPLLDNCIQDDQHELKNMAMASSTPYTAPDLEVSWDRPSALSPPNLQPSSFPNCSYDYSTSSLHTSQTSQFFPPAFTSPSQDTPSSTPSNFPSTSTSATSPFSNLPTPKYHTPYTPQQFSSDPPKCAKDDICFQSFQPSIMTEYNVAPSNDNLFGLEDGNASLEREWMPDNYCGEADLDLGIGFTGESFIDFGSGGWDIDGLD